MDKVFYFKYDTLKDYITKSFECVFKKLPVISKKGINILPKPFQFITISDIENYLFKLSNLQGQFVDGLSMTLPIYDYDINNLKLTIQLGIIIENTTLFNNLKIPVDVNKLLLEVRV